MYLVSLAFFAFTVLLYTLTFPSCDGFVLMLTSSDIGCRHCRLGGDDGIRTHDPLLAGQVLSQLSYTPICNALACIFSDILRQASLT